MKQIPVLKDMKPGFFSLLKWLPLTALVGAVLGVVGSGFHHAIDHATHYRAEYPWIIWFLPVVGALIALIYKGLGLAKDPGTNIVLRSVYSEDNIPFRLAPAIFLGATLTHLAGGSSGREGAALPLGGSIASWIGRMIKLSKKDKLQK